MLLTIISSGSRALSKLTTPRCRQVPHRNLTRPTAPSSATIPPTALYVSVNSYTRHYNNGASNSSPSTALERPRIPPGLQELHDVVGPPRLGQPGPSQRPRPQPKEGPLARQQHQCHAIELRGQLRQGAPGERRGGREEARHAGPQQSYRMEQESAGQEQGHDWSQIRADHCGGAGMISHPSPDWTYSPEDKRRELRGRARPGK